MCDEVDALGIERGHEDIGEMTRIVISFMQNLDTLHNGVVLLGATNRLDIIDKALLRRFTQKYEITRYAFRDRYFMAQRFLDSVNFPYETIDLMNLAKESQTQAELTNKLMQTIAEHIKAVEVENN